jgi:glycosyltransferase involved in cell wall biosynthesis
MKIGFYIGEIQEQTSGGSATFQASILNELIKTESKHDFYILYDNKARLFEDNENVKFVNMDVQKGEKRFFLNEKVLEHNIELVWFLSPSYHFVEAPFILTIWDLQHRLQPYFPEVNLSGWTFDDRENFYKNAISKASYIITGNLAGAKEVGQFYNFPDERIKIIPFSTPQFVFEKNENDEILSQNNLEKNKYLFYPAQFWPHKNHIRIIKALNILKKQGIDFKVAFSGSDKGNEKYIKEKVKEYHLENDVKFLGFVSEAELISLYKNAFAMTYASMFGPNNLPPLEAMALNCPVICANAKGMQEQLGDAALFFDSKDENDLVQKIKTLLNNNDLKKSLIRKGNDLSFSLTSDKYVQKIINLIHEFAPIRECWSNSEKYTHL